MCREGRPAPARLLLIEVHREAQVRQLHRPAAAKLQAESRNDEAKDQRRKAQ
jgi:hypothetical protein